MVEKSDFTKLAEVVCDHLASIQDALREYQQNQCPEDLSVSRQLQTVLNRVRDIETDALRTRELLDAEKHKSNHDELTGLPNRAAYGERAFHELRRFKRYKRPLCLAVCDIDYFKKINDRFGHIAGDRSLKVIASFIVSKLRTVDFVARLGGEEFVMLLPETTEQQAQRFLDKIRVAISRIPFKYKNQPFQITLSFGISELVSDDSIDSAFERADTALYAAKNSGRNRCCIESKKSKKKVPASVTSLRSDPSGAEPINEATSVKQLP